MLILMLIGSGIAALCSAAIWLLSIKRKTSPKESFEESSRRRDQYLEQMRHERFVNTAADELKERL
jgi:hypothetical protein